MRTPEALETLVEYGLVEEVLRPLMSGKEAQIYLVRSGGGRAPERAGVRASRPARPRRTR